MATNSALKAYADAAKQIAIGAYILEENPGTWISFGSFLVGFLTAICLACLLLIFIPASTLLSNFTKKELTKAAALSDYSVQSPFLLSHMSCQNESRRCM